jgi:hypothetical protein
MERPLSALLMIINSFNQDMFPLNCYFLRQTPAMPFGGDYFFPNSAAVLALISYTCFHYSSASLVANMNYKSSLRLLFVIYNSNVQII